MLCRLGWTAEPVDLLGTLPRDYSLSRDGVRNTVDKPTECSIELILSGFRNLGLGSWGT